MLYHKNSELKRNIPALAALLVCGFTIFISSCRNGEVSSRGTKFQLLVDSATAIYDAGNTKTAIALIDSVYPQYTGLTLNEKFSYYNLKYNISYHKLHDRSRAMLYADSMLGLFDDAAKRSENAAAYGHAHFLKGDLLLVITGIPKLTNFYQGKNHSACGCPSASRLLKAMVEDLAGKYRRGRRYFFYQPEKGDSLAAC